ncbi:hypothetical protein P3W53_18800 [Pseudomonas denitrificans (nom. rej.)]|nr:hypothetical protein [Pseudomonas denitrificans (nom. rej.)]
MNTPMLFVGASLLANLQSSAPPIREQARSYKKNKSLMETAV